MTTRFYVRMWGIGLMLLALAGVADARTVPGSATAVGVKAKALCLPDPSCKEATGAQFSDTTNTATAWLWNFGDPTSVTGNTATTPTANHAYSTPGQKTVVLRRTLTTGPPQSVTFTVTINVPPPPFQKWRTDTTICAGEKITLDPYPNGTASGSKFGYLWYPKGDSTRSIRVDSSGCYSVEVLDSLSGCTVQDRINVAVCPEKSQSQGVKWYFGSNAGLDFSGGGSPKPIDNGKLNTFEGASSIADTKGKLLFYTDGIRVYDRNGNIMPNIPASNTATLGGNTRSTQSALIVPKPTCKGCEYLYYVYTTSEINGNKQLTYSIVDMRRNKGNGAVVEKNIPVAQNIPSTERSASVRNDRDSTYWVITHDFGANVFRVTHLTNADSPTSKTFAIGLPNSTSAQGEGYLKIGPADTSSAKKADRPLANVIPGPPRNTLQIMTFNDSTGTVTGPPRTIDLGPAPPRAYGVEFAPDGKSVYVSMVADTAADGRQLGQSFIYRFDISTRDPDPVVDSDNIARSKTTVDSSTTRQYGALQIASDGKIYVAVKGAGSLGVIENPNGGLLDSLRFNPAGQSLGGKISQYGLPNQVAQFNNQSSGPSLTHADTCANQPTTFNIGPNCPKLKEQYTLTFGDGSAPKSFTQASPQTHTFTRPGSYTASLRIITKRSDGGICRDTTIFDPLTIVETPRSFSLGPDQRVCKPTVDLTINTTAKIYVWVVNGRVAGRQPKITIKGPGAFEVIAFAANGGCFQSDTVLIRIQPSPTLDLGPNVTLCLGSSTTLTVPQQTWNAFQWSNGNTQRSNVVSKPGLYTVTAQNAAGCENSDSIRVFETPRPTLRAVIGNPTGCTIADGFIELTPIPGGLYSYVWSSSGTTPISLTTTVNRISTLTENVYRVRATNENQCVIDSAFTLKSPANLLRITPVPGIALCSRPGSGSATLTIQGGRPTGFTWRDNAGASVGQAQTLTGVQSGTYSVQVSDAGGCRAFATNVVIRLDSTGFANLGPDRGRCVNDTILLIPSGAAVAGNVFQWSTGQTTPTISVSAPGSYSIVVRNTVNGCVGRDVVALRFNPKPDITAGPAVSLCQSNQAVQLTGNTPAGGFWFGPRTDSTGRFTPGTGAGGTAPVSVTYAFSRDGCANTAVKLLIVSPIPQVNAGPDAVFCAGSPQAVLATGTPGVSYTWSNGTSGATLRPPSSGTYVVTGLAGGCPARDTVVVTVNPAPQVNLLPAAFICIGDAGNTTLTATGQLTGVRFAWNTSTADTTRLLLVSRTGQYSLVATNRLTGCRTNLQTQVTDRCEPRAFVPTAFTPNGDGVNDVLEVFTAYTTDYELRIFDRWGEVIFATTSPEVKWDGSYKGEKYPPMVYAYIINYGAAYFPDRPRVTRRGSVLIIR